MTSHWATLTLGCVHDCTLEGQVTFKFLSAKNNLKAWRAVSQKIFNGVWIFKYLENNAFFCLSFFIFIFSIYFIYFFKSFFEFLNNNDSKKHTFLFKLYKAQFWETVWCFDFKAVDPSCSFLYYSPLVIIPALVRSAAVVYKYTSISSANWKEQKSAFDVNANWLMCPVLSQGNLLS